MNGTLKVIRFHLRDSRNSLAIFYAIVVGLSLLAATLMLRNVEDNVQFGGVDAASAIFLFVVGLNAFTTGFRFMQANNVSRQRYYIGTAIALTALAAMMALIDTVYGTFLRSLIPYESILTQLYRTASPLTVFVWSFALYALMAHAGWMITMMYYRSNRILRLLISLSPMLGMMSFMILDYWADGNMSRALVRFFTAAFGFTSVTPNPYVAVCSLLVGAAGAAAISFLLIRRVSLRAQG